MTSRKVEGSDIDELGHVNNVVYLQWVQDAAIEHWNAISSTELQSRYKWFCSRHEIDYKSQLYENEEVEIKTWIAVPRGARFDRFVDIRKKGSKKASVIAKTTWVLIDAVTERPRRVGADVAKVFGVGI